jgi:hypothetical protein
MATWSCPICTSAKHGKYTTVCNHEICGRCFLTLHANALTDWSSEVSGKSKCPFCRQAFTFEDNTKKKIRSSLDTVRWLKVRVQQLNEDVRRLRRVRHTLVCTLK